MLKSKSKLILLFLLLSSVSVVLKAQTNPVPKGFAFTLKTNCTTSAGVYKTDGTLVRTLWSGEKFAAGDYTKFWDGYDESGNIVSEAEYVYKVLSNNVTAVWEGVIGNTTKSQVGFFDVTHSMAFNNSFGYMAAGYEEQQPVAYKFPLNDINNVTAIGGKAATTKFVAADNSHVYWGASDASRHWVYATNVSNDKPYLPAKGISVSVFNTPDCPGAIDVFHDQAGTANSNATITGLAVQKNNSYLFVSHGGLNKLNVLDKLTGELIQSLYVQNPGSLSVDDSDNLWMISGTNTVAKYTVNSNGNLSAANLIISGVANPVAIATRGSVVLVSDLSTQQVRSFNSSTGAVGAVLGTAGGYENGPEITNTKFYWKDKRYAYYGTFLAFQTDGSFWVGDGGQTNQHYGNCRYLRFFPDFGYKDQIMYIPAFYSCVVDKNNPTRAFANYLEFKVNYNQPARDNWQFLYNWGYNVILSKDDLLTRLKGLQTLSNGRTYAAVGGGMMDMVELQPGLGLRYTGVQYSINSQLYPDGNLYTMNESKPGQVSNWYKNSLLGFDASNNPNYSTPLIVETTPVITNQDPVFTGNLSTLTSGERTKSGVFVSFDGNTPGQKDNLGNFKATVNPSFRSTGYHLGGVKNGKWLWKTALITHPEYSGPYPTDGTYDIGNGGNQYSGSKALVQDELILWGHHGEFWKGGQTNMWNVVYENGLFVNQFGTYAQGQAVDGMAGNAFSASVIKVGEELFLYTNDESYHSGLHRWRIMGLNTIEVQTAQLMPNATVPDEGVDLMEGLPFNSVLKTDTYGWTRNPENEDYTNIFKQYWSVKTSVKTNQKVAGRDIFAKFRSDNGEATINRDLGDNKDLNSWTIAGKINFDENNGNILTDGGLFFDILDNTGKIIVRIGDERKHISDGKFDRIIWANNKIILSGPEGDLYSSISTFQKLKIVENGGTVSISYGTYEPISSLVFEPGANWQAPKTIRIYFFSKNSNYTRSIAVSELRFKKNTENVVSINIPDAQCPGTGKILREYWNNIPGARIANTPINNTPDGKDFLTSFRMPMYFGDNYGARVSGYVCVPKTGDYYFYIASDDDGELWLSTDANPANKKRIAYVVGYSNEDQYDKFPSQKSAPIALKAGGRYYIEALLKENTGGDHLSVAWRLPDGTLEAPISGSRLIPYDGVKVDAFPIVSINTPTNNQILNSSVVSIQTSVTDYSRIVNKVEFYANSVKIGESYSEPYSLTWNNMINGSYSIVAKALTIKNDVITSQQVSVTVNAPSLIVNPACPGSGSISWEYWLNAPGNTVASIPLTRAPDANAILTSFSTPLYFGDKYGSRIRGYICVPQTGDYTFYITADDEAELWISTDENPANKQKIAFVLGWSEPGQYTKFASQKSKPLFLKAGSRYYIEALHKEESGQDHLTVAWMLPTGVMEAPIPGSKLIPFEGVAVPSISIKTPVLNSVLEGGNVLIETNVVDISSAVSKVEFYAGTVKLGESNTSPYNFIWTNINAGGYSITAQIITNKNEIIKSQSVLVTVTVPVSIPITVPVLIDQVPEPTIKITAPLNNSILTANEVTIETDVADPNAVVSRVDFYLGNIKLAEVSNIPYIYKWQNLAAGKYVLTAKAVTNTGKVINSEIINVSVNTNTPTFAPCQESGSIQWEYWTNVQGNRVSNIPVGRTPDGTKQLTSFSTPLYFGENYGSRIRGYLCVPKTGEYTFYLATDDDGELWLSPNANMEEKKLITYVSGFTEQFDYFKYPSQKSKAIYLKAGEKYYIEALQKEALGADHLSVAWRTPDGIMEAPIPGARLIPFELIQSEPITIAQGSSTPVCQAEGNIIFEYWTNAPGRRVSDIPVARTPDGTKQLKSFSTPLYFGEYYGSRIKGYLCVPKTGDYTFYIATDDDGELWLSPNPNMSDKKLIAYVSGFTEQFDYFKYPSQKSKAIYLKAGEKYYIEALQKEELGGDHLSVAWQLPDGTLESPIPGNRLSPYSNVQSLNLQLRGNPTQTVLSGEPIAKEKSGIIVAELGLKTFPNPFVNTLNIECYIPEESNYSLQLYTIQGMLLKTIFTGNLKAGVSKFNFNGSNLPSGVYICKLASGKKIINKQITLIK